ncbi:MAG: hypothetical protein ACI81R_000105 [Bradymonadia bacterium]
MNPLPWGRLVAAAGALLLLQSAVAPAAAWVTGERFWPSATIWVCACASLVVGAWRASAVALLTGVLGGAAATVAILAPDTRALLVGGGRPFTWLLSMMAYILCVSVWLARRVPSRAVDRESILQEPRAEGWEQLRSALAVALLVVPALFLQQLMPTEHSVGSDSLMLAHGALAFGWIVALFTSFIDIHIDRRTSEERERQRASVESARWVRAMTRPALWLVVSGGLAWVVAMLSAAGNA